MLLPKCLHWPFCPGVFIAILAFVAAAVTFRREPGTREKAMWTFLFLSLMCAEVWMMSIDRETNETQQRQSREIQLKGFKDIGDGITETIANSDKQFDETMTRIGDTLKTSERTLRNTQPYATLEYEHMDPYLPSFPIAVGHQLRFNVTFINSGIDTARHYLYAAKIYVRRPDNIEDEKEIADDFNERWKHSAPPTTPPAGSEDVNSHVRTFFTFDSDIFTDSEVKGILDHTLTMYTLIRLGWQDKTGKWFSDECFSFQDPTHDLTVGHPCHFHNERRYKAN